MMLLFNFFALLLLVLCMVSSGGPFFLAFFLLFYSVGVSFVVSCCCVSLYGLLLFLVMGGSIVVAFLFAVSVLEIHSFYEDKLKKNLYSVFSMGIVFMLFFSSIFLEKFNDFFVCLMYSSFVLLGLAIVIIFCLLGVVKSCSFGSGPLRSLRLV